MRFNTLFGFALIAFTAAPALANYADWDYVEARDVDAAENVLATRALQGLYEEGHITARDLGEAIDDLIYERQLAGEDTQELEARLFSLSAFPPYHLSDYFD
jgi:hypothetical protein